MVIRKVVISVATVKINPQYRGQLGRALVQAVPWKRQVHYPPRPEQVRVLDDFAIGK